VSLTSSSRDPSPRITFRDLDVATLERLADLWNHKYQMPVMGGPEALASESLRYDYAIKLGQWSILKDIDAAIQSHKKRGESQ